MGACLVKRNTDNYSILSDVQKIIELNDITDLIIIAQTPSFKQALPNIDQCYFTILDLKLNLLSLSAFHSATDSFKYIHTELKASFTQTDTFLKEQNTSLIDIICTRGTSDLLQYYLPYFSPLNQESSYADHSETLSFTEKGDYQLEKKPRHSLTAVQKACEQGNINILNYIHKHFKNSQNIPYQLNIDHQDEITGENCALISCRKMNFVMIKFLHSVCKSNFRILNKQGENAIQILSASHKKNPCKEFHEIFVYLVNFVRVDYLYNHEETVLLLNCERTVAFFEKKLRDKGIEVDKISVEERFKIVKTEEFKSIIEEKIESFEGKNYTFCDLYGEVMDQDDVLSEIDDDRNRGTPFASIIGEV